MSRLTAEAQNKIRRLVESGRIRSGVTVVVVNSIFTDILRAWMAKPGAPPKDEILILACDAQAEEIWAKEGIAVVAHVTDGSLWDLFSKRHEVIAVLCEAGVDAFHSDADAFWLRDPREYCRSLPADLVVSQGTALPPEAGRAWGFVLCTGFFYTRASTQTAAFFRSVAERIGRCDQAALNLALLEARTAWTHLSIPSEKLSYRGMRWDQSKPDICISYYDQPVFGRSEPLDINLCLLPHRLFSRLGPTHETTMVAHLLNEKNEEWRRHIAALRARHAEGASLPWNNEADSSSARQSAATTRPRA
jgi:hypothetical protein